jgi:hypothetical protein
VPHEDRPDAGIHDFRQRRFLDLRPERHAEHAGRRTRLHAAVLRDHHVDVVANPRQRPRQRPHDIGQPPRLRKGDRLGRHHQDTHGASCLMPGPVCIALCIVH